MSTNGSGPQTETLSSVLLASVLTFPVCIKIVH
jgi:hypothetical protein